MPYDNMPFKNKQAAKSDRTGMSAGPGDPPDKFDKIISQMNKKISEVDQKIGGTKAGDDKIRSIRGTHEAAASKASPEKWKAYQVDKIKGKEVYTTQNKFGNIVTRKEGEGTIDK